VKRDRRLAGQLERRLGAVVVAWALLLAANDALPYLGLRDDSCQTMFSGLEWGERETNHLFLPQHAVSDVWAYVEIRDLALTPRPGDGRLVSIAAWLERPERALNTEALRVATRQLCDGGIAVSLATRRTDGRRGWIEHRDACADPSVSSPHARVPVRLYETDIPLRERP
jgi:hypothetical protein